MSFTLYRLHVSESKICFLCDQCCELHMSCRIRVNSWLASTPAVDLWIDIYSSDHIHDLHSESILVWCQEHRQKAHMRSWIAQVLVLHKSPCHIYVPELFTEFQDWTFFPGNHNTQQSGTMAHVLVIIPECSCKI